MKWIEFYGKTRQEVSLEHEGRKYGIIKRGKPIRVPKKLFDILIKQKDMWRVSIKANVKTIRKIGKVKKK